jgi:hypothetical protein
MALAVIALRIGQGRPAHSQRPRHKGGGGKHGGQALHSPIFLKRPLL